MQRVVDEHPNATLVLAGPREDKTPPGIEAPWRQTLGFVSEDDLVTLYRTAEALVMPSTYEGFGLPVLEAMSFGTPVICARASSLPEVGGDAAAWVNPDDDRQVARAISRLIADPGVKASMRAASLAQAARFSWEETARQTLAAFDDAIAVTRQSRQG
jgi:glycosyltransferase involved in cell wall biosynthesis